jgi:hypothetical protein
MENTAAPHEGALTKRRTRISASSAKSARDEYEATLRSPAITAEMVTAYGTPVGEMPLQDEDSGMCYIVRGKFLTHDELDGILRTALTGFEVGYTAGHRDGVKAERGDSE